MKIRINKDIPGYKAGEELKTPENMQIVSLGHTYVVNKLIKEGWAEEVKELDIDEIRRYYGGEDSWIISGSSLEVYSAFTIVSKVIQTLNGDWKLDWKDYNQAKYAIYYNHEGNEFEIARYSTYQNSILLYCKSQEIAEQVIKLCDKELRLLFNVEK